MGNLGPITQPPATRKHVDAEFKRRVDLGFDNNGDVYDVDDASLLMLIGQAAIGGATWRLKDNTSVTLTASEMVAVSTAAFSYVAALRVAASAIKDLIESDDPTAPATAADVRTHTGWP